MTSPAEIIDAEAARRLLPVPVMPHAALGPDFVAACIAARDAEWRAELKRERQPEGALKR